MKIAIMGKGRTGKTPQPVFWLTDLRAVDMKVWPRVPVLI